MDHMLQRKQSGAGPEREYYSSEIHDPKAYNSLTLRPAVYGQRSVLSIPMMRGGTEVMTGRRITQRQSHNTFNPLATSHWMLAKTIIVYEKLVNMRISETDCWYDKAVIKRLGKIDETYRYYTNSQNQKEQHSAIITQVR